MVSVLRNALLAAIVACPLVVRAQSGPDLSDLMVEWARGRYASPVMCEIDGELVRGIRRVIIRDERTPGRPASLLVQLVDMHPGEATRCVNSLGRPQPNAQGKLQLRLPGRPHPETARRDFKLALKRDRGFDLEIVRGVLKLQTISDSPSQPTVVEFQGGRASLRMVMPATDAARELSDFQSPRKILLELEAAEGETLVLPLFLIQES